MQIGFGDASKSGFGAISTIQTGNNLTCVDKQCCDDMMEESSNYRELANLVKTTKDTVEAGTTLMKGELIDSSNDGEGYEGSCHEEELAGAQ